MRWGALFAVLLCAGCERKAPGPAECVAFAELALGARPSRATHDELVRQCLTTPFDERMLRCVERSGAYRACRAELELRRRENL
jgi:hypothetical protein